jgi:Tfp pilus assembly protein PilN
VRQQVNLIPPDTERFSRKPFSFYFMLTVVTGLVVVSVLLSLVAFVNHNYAGSVALLEETKKSNQLNLDRLRAQAAANVPSGDLLAQIDQMQASLASHQRLYNELVTNRLGNNIGFSGLLVGLAQHKPEPVWLTSILMASGGQHIDLHGRTIDATAIPAYLQRLGKESAFSGRAIDQLEITQGEPEARHLDFSLRSGVSQ